MENQISIKREGFGTKFGAIAAAAGAAVGLGNIWNFPYLTGKNGGGAFIVIYIFCVLLIGLPIMISGIMFLIGIPCALSIGAVQINLFGVGFFDFIIFLVEAIFLPVGGLMIVIFVGWRLKKKDIEETLSVNGVKAWYQDSYLLLIRFIVPVVIVAVLVKTFIDAF